MSDKKSKDIPDILVHEVSISGKVTIKWEQYNSNIDAYEETSRKFKERPKPSFFDSASDVIQQAAQSMGYPNKHESWGAYKPKKIKLSGLKVEVEFLHFTNKCREPIQTKIPEINDVTAEVIEDFIAEVREFITSKKPRTGDLFTNDIHGPDIEIEDAEIIEETEEPAAEDRQLEENNVEEEGLVPT